jgi:hypothetical protein
LIISHQLIDDAAQNWETLLFADSCNDVVDARLAEIQIVSGSLAIILTIFLETFWRSEPAGLNVFININHELENQLEHVFE